MSRTFLSVSALALVTLTACGREAQPADMHEAATNCGIRAFEAVATRDADQSDYTLHYQTEADSGRKIECYENYLRSKGLEGTLALGNSNELRDDDGLLFARVGANCKLPRSALISQRDGGRVTIFGASRLWEAQKECASQQLRASGRFREIEFTDEAGPLSPSIRG